MRLVPPDGKGIVDPIDDFRHSNPAVNQELLDYLAKYFAEGEPPASGRRAGEGLSLPSPR
jgi:hypothetical protein